ncbi:uncharacterized protein LOC121367009, partial [Gigantopelta aegis]|uniref:uncharacterized protein LOC121367009 n=1 Tax=Gigantopelta aegis TaxID=1735272 RepID=UPI001B8899AA
MADSRLYLCYSVLLIFLGCTFDIGIENVCGLPRHKLSKCFTTNSTNYTVDLGCKDGSLIHVIKENYSNSSSSDTCTQDHSNCRGREVENNRIPSTDFRLQTACNAKSECNETLDPFYFNCTGRRMGTVDYECVPGSMNYNMCDNLIASTKLNESVVFFESPTAGRSDPILCSCEILGQHMRVKIVDFHANMMDKEKWFLNITSGFMLNDSTPSNSSRIRLLNNVLGGYHDTVHITYYSENLRNQNIWIELT